jgi:hypothetical protein
MEMDYQSRLRKFWVRIVLAFGIFWGIIPFITVTFITRGMNDSVLDVLAPVFSSLTILPASILGFWHRRSACVWLSANAALTLPVAVRVLRRNHQYGLGTIISLAVPVLIAILLDFMEIKHWPGALDREMGSELAESK